MSNCNSISTVSLFSGGGGLDLGFSAANYEIKLSIELDSYSCKTLEINTGKKSYLKKGIVLNKNISDITIEEMKEALGNSKEELGAVIGGPPCQSFSVFGRRNGMNDPRGNLIWEYLRVIKGLKPKVFIFENVAGLRTIHNGELYTQLLEELSCNGLYTVSDHNYEIADYGIPQFRNRIFFIGVKKGRRIPPMKQTHGDQGTIFNYLPFTTVGQVLRNMPEPEETDIIPNHRGRLHSKRIIDRYKNLSFGERDHHTRINKLDPIRPSFTIIVGSDKGGGKGHIHPYSPREVTPRESARLQTFPDWWEFYGKGRHVIRQVGNAVPPLFAALLAQHIRKYSFCEKSNHSYDYFIKKLGIDFLY